MGEAQKVVKPLLYTDPQGKTWKLVDIRPSPVPNFIYARRPEANDYVHLCVSGDCKLKPDPEPPSCNSTPCPTCHRPL